MRDCVTHHHACDCREAEFAALRERVATLEGGIRIHKAGHEDCGDADCGCVTSGDRRLWSLLDVSDDQEDE